jgi:DNA modification methylase
MTVIPQIELRPISSLVAYARNARTHSDSQVQQLMGSLLEFGWTNAVLADAAGIVAGHGRVMAASQLYREGRELRFPNGAPIPPGMVPVVDCSGWSEQQRRAYILADNKLALNAGWDEELLQLELGELREAGFDLAVAGWDAGELTELLGPLEQPGPEVDPEDVPEAPAVPVSRLGDIWVCGPHRVGCGDSLSAEFVGALMGGELADLCITDPPYNVAYESKLAGSIKNDDMADAEFRRFLLGAFQVMVGVMKPGAPVYVSHADGHPGEDFRSAFREAGFKLAGCLIWRKNQFTLSRSDYQWQHEPILYGWKPGARHRWYGGRKRTTVVDWASGGFARQLEDGRWLIEVGGQALVVDGQATLQEVPGSVIFHEKPSRSALHPTTKPVGLWEKLMEPSSRPGDIVVDPFSGSGTTLVAADRMGLIARVCDLDPKFVDVAVIRWQALTGRRAVHAVTGEAFPIEGNVRVDAVDPRHTNFDVESDPF